MADIPFPVDRGRPVAIAPQQRGRGWGRAAMAMGAPIRRTIISQAQHGRDPKICATKGSGFGKLTLPASQPVERALQLSFPRPYMPR